MAATMSAVRVIVAPAASSKMQARSSSFASASTPKVVAAKRAAVSVRAALRVTAALEEPLVRIGTRGR